MRLEPLYSLPFRIRKNGESTSRILARRRASGSSSLKAGAKVAFPAGFAVRIIPAAAQTERSSPTSRSDRNWRGRPSTSILAGMVRPIQSVAGRLSAMPGISATTNAIAG